MAASMSACVRCRKIDHLTKQNKVVRGKGKRENKTKTKINKWNARKINWIARTSEWDTKEGAQHSWRIEAGPNTTNQATSPNDASEFFFAQSLDSHSSPSLSCSLALFTRLSLSSFPTFISLFPSIFGARAFWFAFKHFGHATLYSLSDVHSAQFRFSHEIFVYSNFDTSELFCFCTASMHHNCFDKWSAGEKK